MSEMLNSALLDWNLFRKATGEELARELISNLSVILGIESSNLIAMMLVQMELQFKLFE